MRRKARLGVRQGGQGLASFGNRLGHGLLEDRDEQVVLASEVEVDGAGGDAGLPRDVGDLRAEEAVPRKHPRRGGQDAVALVAARGRARQADGAAGDGAGGGRHGVTE